MENVQDVAGLWRWLQEQHKLWSAVGTAGQSAPETLTCVLVTAAAASGKSVLLKTLAAQSKKESEVAGFPAWSSSE